MGSEVADKAKEGLTVSLVCCIACKVSAMKSTGCTSTAMECSEM